MKYSLLIALLLILIQSCTTTVAGNGSGSEVTNGFTIEVVNQSGNPVQADVTIRPESWVTLESTTPESDSTRNGVTNDEGILHIDSLKLGDYRLVIATEDSTFALYDGSIVAGDDLDFGSVTVTLPGGVEGVIDLSESGEDLKVYVQLAGTEITTLVEPDGSYLFESVPEGDHRVYVRTEKEQSAPNVTETVLVVSEEVVEADTIIPNTSAFNPSLWSNSASIELNTTASGEQITGNLLPLLLRITPAVADLTNANPNHSDLRLIDSEHEELPFEIISVVQDTVFISLLKSDVSYSTTDEISLYWGNKNVQSASNPALLNDTASQVALSYHGEEASGLPRNDASQNQNHTVAGQVVATIPDQGNGIIGNAILFDAVDDYLVVPSSPSLNTQEQLTIMFWTKFVKRGTKNGRFFSKWQDWEIKENKGKLQFSIGGAYVISETALANDSWTHITVTMDLSNGTPSVILRENGEILSIYENMFPANSSELTRNGSDPLYIGSLDGVGDYLNGSMDEIKIWNRILNDSEIQAIYHSQKSGSMLFQ